MFITKKHLDRRTFLRGVGATVALPLLDAMVPARTLLAFTAARPAARMAFVYFPHGAIMDEWTASTPDLEFGRILQPLAPFRHRLTVVSGLENRHAYGPVHTVTPGTWLSGVSPRKCSARDASNVSCTATADQLAAHHLGHDTPLSSIAVAAEEPRRIGAGIWEGEYDAIYSTTISFRGADAPVPMEFRPRRVFDALFHPPSPGRRQAGFGGSVLDLVAGDTATLRSRLGSADRAVLGDYLETVRDVERRVDQAEGWADDRFIDRLALMFDLIALAFRADITRVASVMIAAEASSQTYDHLGVPESFHALSHHQNDPEKIEKLVRIQAFHSRMFAAFVRTLAELPEGDGSLLDRSLILFGSNMSNSHAHDHFPLPLAVVGGGCGQLRGGRHLRYPDRTPISNLLFTLLGRAGVPVASFGDSTGGCDL